MSFLGGHWYPCYGFLVMSPLVLKPEWVLPYSLFYGGKCNVHCPRFTSGATHADLLAAGSAAGHFPTCISRGGTRLGFEWAITWTEDKSATIVPATRLCKFDLFFFLKVFFVGHIHMSYFGATGTPVLDFW